MIHTLLVILLIWWALNVVRTALRGKSPDPMAGRLVARTPVHAAQAPCPAAAAWHDEQDRLDKLDARR